MVDHVEIVVDRGGLSVWPRKQGSFNRFPRRDYPPGANRSAHNRLLASGDAYVWSYAIGYGYELAT